MKYNLQKAMGFFYLILGLAAFINGIVTAGYGVSFGRFFLMVSIPLFLLSAYNLIFFKNFNSKSIAVIMYTIHIITIILGFAFIIIESFIISSSYKEVLEKPDYIVILGAGLRGETPSHTLYKRLEKSLEVIKLYEDVTIIVSGGQGPGETITEAEAMKRYLVNAGIDGKRILKEEASTNTLENLKFSMNVISSNENLHKPTITIVTSGFHMFRSKLLASRVGFNSYGLPSEILPGLVPTYYVREFIALIKSYFFDYP